MLEKQGKIRITASAELGELQKLNESVDKMEAGFLKAVGAASLLNKGMNSLLATVKANYADIDLYSKATAVFTGDLAAMREATKGAVGDLELMQAANKMNTLGVKLSGQQMAQLLGDVKKLSAAMGIDMKSALESTATALARESDKIADNIGIVMKAEKAHELYAMSIGKTVGALTDAEKKLGYQQYFLTQAHEKATKLAEVNSTLTGTFTRLGVAIKNAALSMGHFINTFGESSWGNMMLQSQLQRGGSDFSTWRAGYAKQGWGAGGSGGATWAGDDEDAGFGEYGMQGAYQGGSHRSGAAGFGMGLGYGKLADGGFRGNKGKARSGSKAATGSPFGIREWVYDSLADIELRASQMIVEQQERLKKLMQGQREGDVEAGAEAERGRLGAEFRSFTRRKGAEKKAQELRGTWGGAILGDEAAQNAMKSAEAFALYEKEVRKVSEAVDTLAMGPMTNLAGSMWAAADAAIQGGESFGTAMLQTVKSTLLGIAQQATVKALFATAEGFLLQAATMGIPNPGSISAFAAAGMYGAVAASTGLLGLGLSMATAGSKSGGGAGAAASGGNSYRPSFGEKTSSKDLPPIIVRVVFDRSDPASESFAKRKVRAEMVAAGYQEGA